VVGEEAKIVKFQAWLGEKAEAASCSRNGFYTERQVWEGIADCIDDAGIVTLRPRGPGEIPVCGLAFGAMQTKCYPPWDKIINEIFDFTEELDLDTAYGRVGEEVGDIEQRDSGARVYTMVTERLEAPFECW